jgi:ribosomal protein S27AE
MSEATENLLRALAIFLAVLGVGAFLSLIYSCLYWFWREFTRPSEPAPTSQRTHCPKCGSTNVELLFGADDYECATCGLIWYL